MINFRTPDEPDIEQIDYDDLDEAIRDGICDDEGSLRPLTLLYHLNKRGWTIARAHAHDYPRPAERFPQTRKARRPRNHVHVWVPGANHCRECGEKRS